jgi:hypothetical protein
MTISYVDHGLQADFYVTQFIVDGQSHFSKVDKMLVRQGVEEARFKEDAMKASELGFNLIEWIHRALT